MNKKEQWVSAKYQGIDSKGKYLVSSFGRILSFSRRGKYEFICKSKRRQTFSFSTNEITRTVPLAKVILCSFYGYVFTKDEVADHINNIPWDDRLCNLQKLTISENLNKDKKPNTDPNRYILKVSNSKRYKFKVSIWCGCRNRTMYLGMFETKEQAANARDLIERIILDNAESEWSELNNKVVVAIGEYRTSVNLPMTKKCLL